MVGSAWPGAGVARRAGVPVPRPKPALPGWLSRAVSGWPSRARWAGSLARVRLTAFWDLMRAQFGDAYAESVAKDYVIAAIGDRTVNQALADGEDVKAVWRGVCEAFHLPERVR
jgi:hypothetical protein